MRCPNVVATLIIRLARSQQRTLTAGQRRTLQQLYPACSGVVACMVFHALRYYSVAVV